MPIPLSTPWRPHGRVAAALAVVLVVVAASAPALAQAGDPEVSVDDEADAYIGRGGLVLPPGSTSEHERRRVAECAHCRWRLTDPCAPDGGACLSVTRGCPNGRLLRAWSSTDDGRTWTPVALPCIGPAGPVTVENAGERLSEEVVREVGPARVTHRPPAGILPRIPVRFRPGQQTPPPLDLTVLGRRAEVVARPTWAWSFGDGSPSVAGPPDGAVEHAFGRGGVYEVRLLTTWQARYTVDGLGPFPLEPLHQQAIVPVRVGAGRAILVS